MTTTATNTKPKRIAHNRGSTKPRRDRMIVHLHEEEGWKLAKIGRRLGVTRERVRQLYQRAKQEGL